MEYYIRLKQAEYGFFDNMYYDLTIYIRSHNNNINKENIYDYFKKKYNCFYDFDKDYYDIFNTLELFIVNKIITICKESNIKCKHRLRELINNIITEDIIYNYLSLQSLKIIDKEVLNKGGSMLCKKYNYPNENDIIDFNGYDGIGINVGIYTFMLTFP